MLSSKQDIELDSILGALMPQLVERITSMSRGEREALGFAKYVEDPNHPAWSMQLNVVQPKGFQAPFTDRFDTIEGVTTLLKRMVNDEQEKLYDRIYSTVVGGSGGAKSAQDVFAQWAKDAKIADGAVASKALIQSFLTASVIERANMAEKYAEHIAKVEANKAAGRPVESKAEIQADIEVKKEEVKKATADVEVLEKKLAKGDLKAEEKKKVEAELEKKKEVRDAAVDALRQRMSDIAAHDPKMLPPIGLEWEESGVAPNLQSGDKWTPYFTNEDYLCSPTDDSIWKDENGKYYCDLDTGESGTDFNRAAAAAAKIDFSAIPSVNGPGQPIAQAMPNGWGQESVASTLADYTLGWLPGSNRVLTKVRAIRQPAVSMDKEGNVLLNIKAKKGTDGYLQSVQHDNTNAFTVPKKGYILNSGEVSLRSYDDGGRRGKRIMTGLPCNPNVPFVHKDGEYYCAIDDAIETKFITPNTRNSDNRQVAEDVPQGEHAGIFTADKVQYAHMPATWTPFDNRAVGQGRLSDPGDDEPFHYDAPSSDTNEPVVGGAAYDGGDGSDDDTVVDINAMD